MRRAIALLALAPFLMGPTPSTVPGGGGGGGSSTLDSYIDCDTTGECVFSTAIVVPTQGENNDVAGLWTTSNPSIVGSPQQVLLYGNEHDELIYGVTDGGPEIRFAMSNIREQCWNRTRLTSGTPGNFGSFMPRLGTRTSPQATDPFASLIGDSSQSGNIGLAGTMWLEPGDWSVVGHRLLIILNQAGTTTSTFQIWAGAATEYPTGGGGALVGNPLSFAGSVSDGTYTNVWYNTPIALPAGTHKVAVEYDGTGDSSQNPYSVMLCYKFASGGATAARTMVDAP
jgi:hypothetical protein